MQYPPYPTTMAYAQFGPVITAGEFIHKLGQRGWRAPGVTVALEPAAHDTSVILRVRGQDFSIQLLWKPTGLHLYALSAAQRRINFHWNSYDLTCCVYAGNSWERDRDRFLVTQELGAAKALGLPRLLAYRSVCDCPKPQSPVVSVGSTGLPGHPRRGAALPLRGALHAHRDRWSVPWLMYYNFGDGYALQEDEPRAYRTEEVLAQMDDWMQTHLLPAV